MKTIGLFLPTETAMRLRCQIELIRDMAADGPLREIAAQALETLQSGDVGEYELHPTGSTGEGDQRSDLMTYAANLARDQSVCLAAIRHSEARANAVEHL